MKSAQFPANPVWLLSRVSLSHTMQPAEDYRRPKSPHVHSLIINKDHVSLPILEFDRFRRSPVPKELQGTHCLQSQTCRCRLSVDDPPSPPLGVRFLAVSFQLITRV